MKKTTQLLIQLTLFLAFFFGGKLMAQGEEGDKTGIPYF